MVGDSIMHVTSLGLPYTQGVAHVIMANLGLRCMNY